MSWGLQGAQHPLRHRIAPGLCARAWRRKESCKVPRGVGRSEEGRRKGRTRLSSRGDRGVPLCPSCSSPRQLDVSSAVPGRRWRLNPRPGGTYPESCRLGPYPLLQLSGIRRGRTSPRAHRDLSRVPAAAATAAETPFVLPGPPSLLFSVAAVGWR